MIVVEYMENGALDSFLRVSKEYSKHTITQICNSSLLKILLSLFDRFRHVTDSLLCFSWSA